LVDKKASYYSFAFSAIDIYNYQSVNSLGINDIEKSRITGQIALLFQLGWKYGELIEDNTDINDPLDTLYRYVGFSPDPPEEFIEFMTEESIEKVFWGIEISVMSEF